jgi:hypothetical protein
VPSTVIQACESVAGFQEHGESMEPNIPRLPNVDEPDHSLRSALTQVLLRMFQDPESNVDCGLLLCTSNPLRVSPKAEHLGNPLIL